MLLHTIANRGNSKRYDTLFIRNPTKNKINSPFLICKKFLIYDHRRKNPAFASPEIAKQN